MIQYLLYGRGTDTNAELLEFAYDPSVSPARDLLRHAQDEIDHGHRGARPTGTFEDDTALGLSNPFPIRLRLDYAHHLRNIVVDLPAPAKKAFSCGVGTIRLKTCAKCWCGGRLVHGACRRTLWFNSTRGARSRQTGA